MAAEFGVAGAADIAGDSATKRVAGQILDRPDLPRLPTVFAGQPAGSVGKEIDGEPRITHPAIMGGCGWSVCRAAHHRGNERSK